MLARCHGVPPQQVRRTPCDCAYPEHCDSQLAPLAPTRLALKQLELESQQQQQPQRAEQQHGSQQQPAGAAGAAEQGIEQPQQQPQQHQPQQAQPGEPQQPVAESQLAALEARYVHAVYDAIAPHFAATRFAVWPRVRAFLEGLPPRALLADVGCGNGKYFGAAPAGGFVLASDRSEGAPGRRERCVGQGRSMALAGGA